MRKPFRFVLLFAVSVFITSFSFAQDKPNEVPKQKQSNSVRIEGQIGLSTNGQAFFLNFGGPNIRLQHKKIALGLSLFPSLRIWEDAPRTLLMPTLGFGAYIQYKRCGLIVPLYYNSSKNEWIPSAGFSFKLSK